MSAYQIKFHPKAKLEFDSLDGSLKQEVVNKINKISITPDLGKILGKKFGINLTNCRSVRFDNGNQRIVYQIDKKIIMILYHINLKTRKCRRIHECFFENLTKQKLFRNCFFKIN